MHRGISILVICKIRGEPENPDKEKLLPSAPVALKSGARTASSARAGTAEKRIRPKREKIIGKAGQNGPVLPAAEWGNISSTINPRSLYFSYGNK